jgi:hypothetical protein
MNRHFTLGLLLGVCLAGCGGFAFRWYGLRAVSYEGTLRGPEPKDDLPFARCSPTPEDQGPCVVMLTPEFEQYRKDYDRCKVELKDCQSRCD